MYQSITLTYSFAAITGSLENRIAHYAKKRRIEIVNKDELDSRKTEIVATNDDDGNE